jgi:glycine/D-amino acid oxidase-like deaminating enzyme
MQVDVLIIGQGICGTMLSWYLRKEGKTFLVIDNGDPSASSKVAAGVINPITGRRYVTTWMIADLMEFAKDAYEKMGTFLDSNFIFEKSIIDFFPSAQMRNAFTDRITENDTYLHTYPHQNHFNPHFNYEFGCGEISPAFMVNFGLLLAAWRKELIDGNSLRETEFDNTLPDLSNGRVKYEDIDAEKIIFCDGIKSMNYPLFELLPFAPNKGEALVIETEGLPHEHIYKKGMVIAPLPIENTWWVGSNYQWEFKDDQPSEDFYKQATSILNGWLKTPYKILFHKAAVRPATLERRPFVGFHPHMPQVGILNGMGTKGASLAPWFAWQLSQHIVYNYPISEEASIHRFSRLLGK